MSFYESTFIVRQDVAAAQVEAITATFADIVRAQGGQVTKTEQWGLRTLTYRIKKNKKGHYVLFNLDATPEAVAELERNMRFNEDVLRYLTVRVEELEAGPSAMMRKEERADRPFGDRERERERDRPRRARPESGETPETGVEA
jgi:small subunit ribosomal protein S6